MDDEEDPRAPGGVSSQPATPPTFAQLQQKGMPRPPAYGAGKGAYPRVPLGAPPPRPPGPGGYYGSDPSKGYHTMGAEPPMPGGPSPQPPQPPGRGDAGRIPGAGRDAGHGGHLPGGIPFPGVPTNELNQGNLEAYLYQMLADPTQTLSYKNSMKQIGSQIDTDASKRGVFYSTLPVGAYSNAGASLAADMQQKAFDNLQGYNNDYERLLMMLLGQS